MPLHHAAHFLGHRLVIIGGKSTEDILPADFLRQVFPQ